MTSKSSTSLKLDGIVRVSKTGEREYLRSPDQQRRDLEVWAKENGHELVHVHVAIDASAGKGGHPAIEAAKARALDGVVDGVVSPYLSRFTRNTLYGLTTVKELLDAKKKFFSLDCPFDLATPAGQKYLTNQLAEAEYEWHVRKGNFERGVSEAIERGAHLGQPFGYAKSNGKGSKLKIVPAEAEAVRLAFELRADGHTWASIAERLNASGTLPRPRKNHGVVQGALWQHKTIRHLVMNEVYLGTAFNGSSRHPGAHEAIVTPELYAKANKTKGVKHLGPTDGYLLTGLLRCSGCGYVMTHAGYGGKRYYRCRPEQHGAGRCPAPVNVPAGEIEAYVVEQFKTSYLGKVWEGEATDGDVLAAEDAVEAWRGKLRIANRLVVDLGESPDSDELELAEEEVSAAKAGLRDAKDALARSRMNARGADLPAHLDERVFDSAPIPERRLWLSQVYRCVVVFRSVGYRQPVAERARFVDVGNAPADSTRLIPFVVGLG